MSGNSTVMLFPNSNEILWSVMNLLVLGGFVWLIIHLIVHRPGRRLSERVAQLEKRVEELERRSQE